jgi:quaternary ammonium compound-resistance protein SugE
MRRQTDQRRTLFICHRLQRAYDPLTAAGEAPALPVRTRSAGALATQDRKGIAMNWFILVLAGLFEIGWAIGLKYTEGFTRLWPTVGTVLAMAISVVLLGIAMKSLPIGTAYAVWVGVGAVGTAILGIVLLGEPANAGRVLSLALIVAGIVGLKMATPA